MTKPNPGADPTNLTPFTIKISNETLDDLRGRLKASRWPDEVEDAGWNYGANLSYMRGLVDYWINDFDWRKQEERINSFNNYRIEVDGVGLHVIHQKSSNPNAIPILLTHGWPSSFYEMLNLVPLLTNPEHFGGDSTDSFDVIIPSIPGYAFSDVPTKPGFHYGNTADLWAGLMTSLGYDRFAAHAYDVGATIMSFLLRRCPERLIGYHTTAPDNPAPYLGVGSEPLSRDEQTYLRQTDLWDIEEGGYMALQTTRPQTLGYGLNDSPVGLAAWIVEKWYAWTEPPNGELGDHFTMDQLLTNVTLYWATQTINSANRLYFERAHNFWPIGRDETIDVPTGVTRTMHAVERPPREYVERTFTDIRGWEDFGCGGHFMALEEPQLMAQAIRQFFHPLR